MSCFKRKKTNQEKRNRHLLRDYLLFIEEDFTVIRVLVVDDSAFMRKMITDFLVAEVQIEVIRTARNGEEALKKIELLKPDVVTLDIEMPVMNGTDTLRKIISIYKLPVIMVSSQTQQGKDRTINCLEMGAFDFITKPSGAISLDLYKIKERLIERVIAAGLSRAQKPEAAVKESSIPERPALADLKDRKQNPPSRPYSSRPLQADRGLCKR